MSITFVGGTYEASQGSAAEWPPHPGRVFHALVGQAEPGTADDEALIWLEQQPPPVVHASEAKRSTITAFVPTNRVGAKDKDDTHQVYLGRTAGSRTWHRALPERDQVHLVWEGAAPNQELRRTLSRLCRRVPYLGRASSPVVMSLGTDAPDEPGLQRWEQPGDGTVRLRAARPGSLAALRQAYADGERARTTDRWIPYGPAVIPEPDTPAPVDGPWPELLTFGFPKGRSLDGRLIVRITSAWRSAVLAALGGQGFPETDLALLHGHRPGSGRQCAFLALPHVGEHGDGQVRGLGLALSPDLPLPVRRALLLILGMDIDRPRLDPFFVPGLAADLTLTHGTFDGRLTVTAARWSRPAGARSWETVLPLVLDRYPHRGEDPAAHVAAACAYAGFPPPESVELLPASSLTGAARLRRSDLTRRPQEPARPMLHARLSFAVPVRGPVVLGNLRHLGLGLCLPVAAAPS